MVFGNPLTSFFRLALLPLIDKQMLWVLKMMKSVKITVKSSDHITN